MEITVKGVVTGKPINPRFAYCMPDGQGKTQKGGNINPHISWSGAPESTKSYALIVVDPDVPASFDDANKDGKTLPKELKRRNFYHWLLVDIPAHISEIKEGQDSSGHKEGGKPVGRTAYGINGRNDYGFGGYDGPCPPWNDERLHHYHFRIYALDMASLGLEGPFQGPAAEAAIAQHTLAMAEIIGTYSNAK